MSRVVEVEVAASTSNLGGGFDCVGIAIDRWLRVRVSESSGGPLTVRRSGTLAPLDAIGLATTSDWLVRGFLAVTGGDMSGLTVTAHSNIPIGRGLGSSAAALVAGVRAAHAWCGLARTDAEVIALAAALEGHADNVGAAALGGAVLVSPGAGGASVRSLVVHDDVRLVFAVPDFMLETRRSRAVLPEFVPHRTATGAVARAAALVAGLASADARLLASGLDDVLHVPFRKRLVPGYTDVVRAARDAGAVGATLSGSGSSIVAVALGGGAVAAIADAMRSAWSRSGFIVETFEPTIIRETVCR